MEYLALNLPLFAQTAGKAAEKAAEEPPLLSPWMTFGLIIVLLGLPFLLGTLFARLLQMKDLGRKIGVILLVVELGLAPFVAQYVIGALEQRQYEQQLAEWKQKQSARDQISPDDIRELKEAVPGVNVLGVPEQDATSGEPPGDAASKHPPQKKPAETKKKTAKPDKNGGKTKPEKPKNEDDKAKSRKAKKAKTKMKDDG